jgi:hypothetical protein
LDSECLQIYFCQSNGHTHPCDDQMASAAHLFEFLLCYFFESIICTISLQIIKFHILCIVGKWVGVYNTK